MTDGQCQDSPIERLIHECDGLPVDYWLAHDPRLVADNRLLRAANQQLLAEINKQTDKRATADEILARFYQARAKNPKIMLSKFLRSIGESDREGYIRKRKVAYDKRRKRSS